jgi:hypothetical protein
LLPYDKYYSIHIKINKVRAARYSIMRCNKFITMHQKSSSDGVSEIHAHNMPMSTPLSYVQPGTHIQSRHILHAVRHGARVAKLE